jgi:hypothetical protein
MSRHDLNPKVTDRARAFTVVVARAGISANTARPVDLRRVAVLAVNDLDARHAPAVLALLKKGRHVLEVLEAGAVSNVEVRARLAAAGADEVPSDLRSPNNAHPSGLPYFSAPRS